MCLVEVQSGVGGGVPLQAHAAASLPPEGPATMTMAQYRIEFIQGMGRGVERVVEADKGRERDRDRETETETERQRETEREERE